mgnify:CR=1 FL=1
MLFKLRIIFIIVIIGFYLINHSRLIRIKKFFNHKKFITLKKDNLYNWMNLTKKERYNATEKQSISYLNKRKVLLKQIRKEYKRISKGNSEAT